MYVFVKRISTFERGNYTYEEIRIQGSGGISTLDDIRALAAVGEGAIEGAITGRALYAKISPM